METEVREKKVARAEQGLRVALMMLLLLSAVGAVIALLLRGSATAGNASSPAFIFIAFGAGILSFVSPCCLPLLPVYFANLSGSYSADPEKQSSTPFFHSLFFVLGFTVIFVAVGALVGWIGFALQEKTRILTRIGGVIVIILGLHMSGLIRIPFLYRSAQFNPNTSSKISYSRSFVIGTAFAFSWTPCVGPILSLILNLGFDAGTVTQAIYLLVAYSLGLAMPFLAAGAAFGSIGKHLRRLNVIMPQISLISAVILIAAGTLLLVKGDFKSVNIYFYKYLDFFGLGSKGI
ncbi:MAG: cytochrome c biogenesis protein CcdA [Chloroflexi bacterium]|nr:cytochrome c biogenesis protein CcdA [Chloroflexota bacterium]